MEKKAFRNWEPGRLHLNFPNGNHLSTVWADGTYSDNYDSREVSDWVLNMDWKKRMPVIASDTVEIMFTCGEKLEKKLLKKYSDYQPGSQPIGHITFTQWLEIVNLLAKENKELLEQPQQ